MQLTHWTGPEISIYNDRRLNWIEKKQIATDSNLVRLVITGKNAHPFDDGVNIHSIHFTLNIHDSYLEHYIIIIKCNYFQ